MAFSIQKVKRPNPPIRKTGELVKIHNVKSSGNRQAKAELAEDAANAI